MQEKLSVSAENTPAAPERAPLNRRKFLELALVGAFSLGTAKTPAAEAATPCEPIYPPNRELLIIDFAPPTCDPELAQDIEVTNGDLLARLAINSAVEPNKRLPLKILYAVTAPLRSSGSKAGDGAAQRIPQLAPLEAQLTEWESHGEIVKQVIRNVLSASGHDVIPTLHPIQDLYETVRTEKDALGNTTVFAEMDTDRFINAVSDNSESRIINFSWQAGEVGIKTSLYTQDATGRKKHDMPKVSILGAYRKDAAFRNLRELARICNTYKDKFFLAAAGNFGDELGEAMRTLSDAGLWPDNVLMVGEAFPHQLAGEPEPGNTPKLNALGADIYVATQNARYNPDRHVGSTVATAIASGKAAQYFYSGLKTPRDIKDAIYKDSHILSYPEVIKTDLFDASEVVYGETEILVFDPDID